MSGIQGLLNKCLGYMRISHASSSLSQVLDCVIHAERALFQLNPQLADANVFVHFQSELEHLDSVELWGTLGARETWQPVPTSILKRLLYGLLGLPIEERIPESAANRIRDAQASPVEVMSEAGDTLMPGSNNVAQGSSSTSTTKPCLNGSEMQSLTTLSSFDRGDADRTVSSVVNTTSAVISTLDRTDEESVCCGEESSSPCDSCLEQLGTTHRSALENLVGRDLVMQIRQTSGG